MTQATAPTANVTPTRPVACPKTDCDKTYEAMGTMLAHMRKHHKDATEIESPLGSFPPSNSATILQLDESDKPVIQGDNHREANSANESDPSAQGNSKGACFCVTPGQFAL